ncbi:TPA: hypothetical protein I0F45_RS07990 [Enterococcus faecalis]|nr:hypothetical protein [Enterococcus faecalis]HBI1676919.1 hypothetical protein [Enterococcus faecalis]HBI1679479.1 hypothetical protein [Enterococcus faecalis]HBI1682814.1 hypothetical protein [Enterococcus faecalis]HBI1685521.1 hypothetical protein [Enterococcus faecalis]
MSKRPIYLPIELHDVFELIENGEVENLYFENGDCLDNVANGDFNLEYIKNINFYIKQEYTPIENQEVGRNETN